MRTNRLTGQGYWVASDHGSVVADPVMEMDVELYKLLPPVKREVVSEVKTNVPSLDGTTRDYLVINRILPEVTPFLDDFLSR